MEEPGDRMQIISRQPLGKGVYVVGRGDGVGEP